MPSKIASKCLECPFVYTCDHKEIEGELAFKFPPAANKNVAYLPASHASGCMAGIMGLPGYAAGGNFGAPYASEASEQSIQSRQPSDAEYKAAIDGLKDALRQALRQVLGDHLTEVCFGRDEK